MKTRIFGFPIALVKSDLTIGKKIPIFEFTTTDGQKYTHATLLGKNYIISTFPNVKTRVCHLQTRTMISDFSNYPNTLLFNIATNSKEDFDEWCAGQGLDALMISDLGGKLGKKFGLKMPFLPMLARAVILVDCEGYIRYIEVMDDIAHEPNYKQLKDEIFFYIRTTSWSFNLMLRS